MMSTRTAGGGIIAEESTERVACLTHTPGSREPIPALGEHSVRRAGRIVCVALLALSAVVACGRRQPIAVAVTFQNSWRFGNETLIDPEISQVKSIAMTTLRGAYRDFDVRFIEAPAGPRVIRVEDTPYGRPYFGAAGTTYPASTISSVRFDVLANALLAALHCPALTPCSKARAELVEALGRGVGATAAHEFGHQAGLGGFVLDADCDDCYDGSSTRYQHFFGTKHWSAHAAAMMRRVLPPAARP